MFVEFLLGFHYSGISNESKLKSVENQLNMSCNQLKVN